MKQKVVLKLDLHDDRQKQKALKAVSRLHGIDQMGVDMMDQKMMIVGTVDPVTVVGKLRSKLSCTVQLVSVSPAKDEYPSHWYPSKSYPPPPPYHFVHSTEENPNSCVIC